MWLAFAFGSALFAGVTAILAKIGLKSVNSHLATAFRTIVVLLFAWAMVFITGSEYTIQNIPTKSFVFLLLSGVATGASWLCYFKALQLGNVNKVAPVDKSSTIFTMLLAFLFLAEPLSWISVCGMALMGMGTWLMAQRSKTDTPTNKKWLLYAVLSALFASLTAILSKVGVEDVESNLATAIRTGVVLVVAWIIVFSQGTQKEIRGIGRKNWWFLLFSGIATGLSWLCYYRALSTGPVSIVVPIDKLSIVVTVAFSAIFLHEKLAAKPLFGLALIVAGTLILLL